MSASNLQTVFNDHFVEFISDIQSVFPQDHDILMAKNSLLAVRKANPKMILKIWKTFIVDKYQKEIEAGDLSFFMEKDYSEDIAGADKSEKIMEAINRLRSPIKQMSAENQAKTMKYIQNLTKLAALL
jgi:accessory colonization factor AcfC